MIMFTDIPMYGKSFDIVSNTLTSRLSSFVAIYTAIYIYAFNDKLRHIYMVAYRTFRKMKRRKIN